VTEPPANPDDPEALKRVGLVHLQERRFDLAIQCFRKGLEMRPDSPALWSHLGIALQESGQSAESIESFRKACALRPNAGELHSNLGSALWQAKQLKEAEAACRRAIELKPDLPDAYGNLGNAILEQDRVDEAIAAFEKSIELRPDAAAGYYNLGHALSRASQHEKAADAYAKAVELQPNFVEALTGLGYMLKNLGKGDESLAAFEKAVAAEPGRASLHNNLANALKDIGELGTAIATMHRAIELDPKDAGIHSNLIFLLNYVLDDPKAIGDELRRWNERHGRPLKSLIRPHENDRSADRRLRIGYVSPDLYAHPVGRMMLPLLASHDRTRFEIFCYSGTVSPDPTTRQMQNLVSAWRDTRTMSDAELADQVRRDRIDILVDLAMHTGGNRLLVFAQKPAPVQATYLAYCGSSGLETMDFRLSDPYMDPPGADESGYSEKTIRLANTFWSYFPTNNEAPAEETPASKAGYVTFGCQNNYCKISPGAWTAWFEILRQVAGSRLFIYCAKGRHRERAKNRIREAGIDPHRLVFSESTGADYFLQYREIDLALDPFPYGGGMTTCDAIWMGTPVLALRGKTGVGRGGASIMSNLGLTELIGDNVQDYVRIAADLGQNPSRLNELRRGLRQRMQRSPLMNARQFAADIESAYGQMWQEWLGIQR
jgi:protein O-GlcNAc transferase